MPRSPRDPRRLATRALRRMARALEPAAPAPRRHPRADRVYDLLHLHRDLPEYESRLAELIDFFGWEVGHKAHACRRWFFDDDPRKERFLERMGLSFWEYSVLHQYALNHRFDPRRRDMWPLYDDVVARLERLGGRARLSVLDFGAGLGQLGLGFALDGWDVVLSEVEPRYLDFARFLYGERGLEPTVHQPAGEAEYYDSGADGRAYGCVIEWGVLEHIPDIAECVAAITRGLVPGGVFVTTTLAREWTPELRAFYERDAADAERARELWGPEIEALVAERFDVMRCAESDARVLVLR
jgi:SAM-dependent methyltransferase